MGKEIILDTEYIGYVFVGWAAARTSESPGRLRRYAPYKGLRPLRRFAAIPLCTRSFIEETVQ